MQLIDSVTLRFRKQDIGKILTSILSFLSVEDNPLAGSHSHMTPPPVASRFPIDPTSPPYSTQIHNGVFLNLDTNSSSSDGEVYANDYLVDWMDGGVAGGGANEDANPESVYMFAWALDGRRIGENGAGPTGRADSPSSPLLVSVIGGGGGTGRADSPSSPLLVSVIGEGNGGRGGYWEGRLPSSPLLVRRIGRAHLEGRLTKLMGEQTCQADSPMGEQTCQAPLRWLGGGGGGQTPALSRSTP